MVPRMRPVQLQEGITRSPRARFAAFLIPFGWCRAMDLQLLACPDPRAAGPMQDPLGGFHRAVTTGLCGLCRVKLISATNIADIDRDGIALRWLLSTPPSRYWLLATGCCCCRRRRHEAPQHAHARTRVLHYGKETAVRHAFPHMGS